jgi:hypothetical protein
MKKKFVFILVAQTILILVTLMYAFVQQGIAQEYAKFASENAKIAERNAVRALEDVKLAREKYDKLIVELQECKNKSPH